jgi:hypothetical protein
VATQAFRWARRVPRPWCGGGRQDRILDELIVPRLGLYKAVKALQKKYPEPAPDMFAAFEALERDESNEFAQVRDELTRRLRRDTDVILHLYKHRFAELFDDKTLKIALQNRLPIYLLYKCGGFVPTFTDIDEVCDARHSGGADYPTARHQQQCRRAAFASRRIARPCPTHQATCGNWLRHRRRQVQLLPISHVSRLICPTKA